MAGDVGGLAEAKHDPQFTFCAGPQRLHNLNGPASFGGPYPVSLEGGHPMRTFDLAPLYRSTVGFDRLFSLLDQGPGGDGPAPTYPPYNIEKTGESTYRISVAVAGFTEQDLSIEVKEQALTIRGEKVATEGAPKAEYLHQGIAARAFERRFQLADYVFVKGAVLQHGLLHVDLAREIPEAMKPRQIAISNGETSRVIEANPAHKAH
jgi:molecular chaperone IbpA